MSKVYIVIGSVDYEGIGIVRCFNSEEDAENLCEQIKEYEKSRINSPEMDASDKEWDEYWEWEKTFLKDHPLSGEDIYDSYYVLEMDVR